LPKVTDVGNDTSVKKVVVPRAGVKEQLARPEIS
jgi:hypothetical protein